ncbi:MAG TPA: S8 family serine peptidase [Caldimonas sp.]|jgi:subtilisin family serine protease
MLASAASGALAADAPRIKVASIADLPRYSYPIPGLASEFVEASPASFDAFAAKVRADVDTLLSKYEIDDRSTLRRIVTAKLHLQELAGDARGGLETVATLRGLEDKPASRLTSGLSEQARLQAALQSGGTSGAPYAQAFRKNFEALVMPLPWQQVQDSVKASYAYGRLTSRASLLGNLQSEIDPAVAKSGAVDLDQAWTLLATRVTLSRALPLNVLRTEVLHTYIAKHDAPLPDIWAAREVTLTASDKTTPVPVAIWDSGIDVALFPDQLFTDPMPTASGTHGLAFDAVGNPEAEWLYPLSAAEQKAYPEFRGQIKGILDLQNGIDSPEATEVQKKFATFSPEQMHDWFEIGKPLRHYIHGTHCAGIAVRGNPAARLVVARFNDELPYLPFEPTEDWARKMGAAFRQMGDYFRSRHVRVVNMSWGDDPAEFEDWLSKTSSVADPAERKRRADALFAIWKTAIEAAIRAAPDTLFVTAAGNSDSNVAFIEDVPASLRLPNLLTVGAVNQAGEETSFTSHGDVVVVHANGYQVDSFVPGGARLRLSGTSMAAPNVVNLAAKLYALDPTLTPARAIELIRAGATTSPDGRRHLIDERRSVALLKQ